MSGLNGTAFLRAGFDALAARLHPPKASVGNQRTGVASSFASARNVVREGHVPHSEGNRSYVLAPKVGDDTAEILVKHAATRILNGKAPLPVVVTNQRDFKAFIRGISNARSDAADWLRSPDPRKVEIGRAVHEATTPGRIPVTNNARSGVLRTLAPEDKVHVFGHGIAGLDGIGYYEKGKPKTFTTADIARQLVTAGLDPNHRVVRLYACEGALPAPAGHGGESNGQQLADALKRVGFANVEVSAYAGVIDLLGSRLEDGSYHRAVTRADDTRVQASQARQMFRPKEDIAVQARPPRQLAKDFLHAAKLDNPTFSRFKASSLDPIAKAIGAGVDLGVVMDMFDSLPDSAQAKYAGAGKVLLDEAKVKLQGRSP